MCTLSKIRTKLNQQQPNPDLGTENWYQSIATCKNLSRKIYKTLVAKIQTEPEKSKAKWTFDCNLVASDSRMGKDLFKTFPLYKKLQTQKFSN